MKFKTVIGNCVGVGIFEEGSERSFLCPFVFCRI